MRLFSFAAVLLACLCFACQSRGQCANGQCGQSFQSYSYAPQAAYAQQSYSTGDSSGMVLEPVYGPLGGFRGYRWVQGPQAPAQFQAVASVQPAKVAANSGCLCGPSCACPLVSASPLEKATPVATKLPASSEWVTVTINGAETRIKEVQIRDGFKPYQDEIGNTYWLRSDMVKTGMNLSPANVWNIQASK